MQSLDFKAAYTARVRQIEMFQRDLFIRHAGNAEKRAAIQAWANAAEELAAVAYDSVRCEVEASQSTRPDTKAYLEATVERMKARVAVLSVEVPALWTAIGGGPDGDQASG